jgi:hypothetical protein
VPERKAENQKQIRGKSHENRRQKRILPICSTCSGGGRPVESEINPDDEENASIGWMRIEMALIVLAIGAERRGGAQHWRRQLGGGGRETTRTSHRRPTDMSAGTFGQSNDRKGRGNVKR